MDFSHEISLLRLEKQKAVKALDFAKAQKIEENIAREQRDDARLRDAGWLPVHFWEKDVLRSLQDCVAEIEDCAVSRLVERAEDAEPLGPEE